MCIICRILQPRQSTRCIKFDINLNPFLGCFSFAQLVQTSPTIKNLWNPLEPCGRLWNLCDLRITSLSSIPSHPAPRAGLAADEVRRHLLDSWPAEPWGVTSDLEVAIPQGTKLIKLPIFHYKFPAFQECLPYCQSFGVSI